MNKKKNAHLPAIRQVGRDRSIGSGLLALLRFKYSALPTMKGIILILSLCAQITLFGQSTGFKEIKNVEYSHPSRTGSISDTLKIEKWKTLDKRKKKAAKKYLLRQEQEIQRDTSNYTKLLYYGEKESIEIRISDSIYLSKELKEPSKKYFWVLNDHPSSRSTYEITSLKRNTGTQKIIIQFKNIKRSASFNIDTAYSQIFIEPEVETKLIRLRRRKKKQVLPRPAKEKIKKVDDRISINHRVPRIYSW